MRGAPLIISVSSSTPSFFLSLEGKCHRRDVDVQPTFSGALSFHRSGVERAKPPKSHNAFGVIMRGDRKNEGREGRRRAARDRLNGGVGDENYCVIYDPGGVPSRPTNRRRSPRSNFECVAEAMIVACHLQTHLTPPHHS